MARDDEFVIPHVHAFVCACTQKDSVYVCTRMSACMDVWMSMWLGMTNLSSRAAWASLSMGHVKKYSMEKGFAWPITLIKMKLKVGACGASDPGEFDQGSPWG